MDIGCANSLVLISWKKYCIAFSNDAQEHKGWVYSTSAIKENDRFYLQICWKHKCKQAWIDTFRKSYIAGTSSLEALFEKIHCPLKGRVPLFSENMQDPRYYLADPTVKPREPRRTWKELFWTETKLARYVGKYGQGKQGGSGIVRLTSSPAYNPQNPFFAPRKGSSPDTLMHYSPSQLSLHTIHLGPVGQVIDIQNYADQLDFSLYRLLPLGHRFLTADSWDFRDGKRDNAYVIGTWTVGRSTSGTAILVLVGWRYAFQSTNKKWNFDSKNGARGWIFPASRMQREKFAFSVRI